MALKFPKKNFIRDEEWRRWLSSQPCMKCKLEGSTQAAHLGKGGGGIKAGDDTCAPLCTLHPDKKGNLVLGCHEKLDQYLETKYWDENLLRAKATVKQARQLWKLGKFEEAERLIREF